MLHNAVGVSAFPKQCYVTLEGSPLVILAIFFLNISVARYYITSLNDCANINGEKTLFWRL